jgi:hypothetical protein
MDATPADLVITGCTALVHDAQEGIELLTIDFPAVVNEMGERMPALLDRSHGKRTQDYST